MIYPFLIFTKALVTGNIHSTRSSKMATKFTKCSGILIACFLALVVQVIFFSPPPPQFPPQSPLLSVPSNGKLQEVIKLGEGLLKRPEDVAIDKRGILYTATGDGFIKRLLRNGTWDDWWKIDSESLLGLTVTAAGDLVVCDAEKGLLKVNDDGVTVLASHVNGSQIWFADDVIESSLDGSIYFSVASTKYGLHNWQLDVLEAEPHGQLLRYDPSSNETSIVLEGLGCANGVALSADEDFLIICESWKYRCLKHWLKGEKKGETEIFIENLPGGPDNINLAPDGSFWIALVELKPNLPRFMYNWRASKYLFWAFPELSNAAFAISKAMVVNVGRDGEIIRGFDDPTGKVMAFVTSAVEFEDHLYFGSLSNDFVGKLPLTR